MIRRTILAALFGCIAPIAASAQETPSRTRVWAAAGLGGGVPASGGDGIGNMLQIVYQKNAHHAAIRGVVLHDIERSTKEIAELGALYGRTNAFSWGSATVAAGVSAVAFDTCPDDDDSCFTPGVPIVIEVTRSRRIVGIGIQAFGNLNSKAAYAGAVLFLQLGRLR